MQQRLAARLDRLCQRVRLNGLGHRRLSEDDTRQLTAALLRDIDETILPRHVSVTTNAGQRFSLDIAGRRLLRLVASGSGGTVGEPDDPVEAAKALAADLKRAMLRATEVTLQSHRMDAAADRSAVGSSAQSLANALGLDLEALDGERILDKALRSLSRHALSLIVLKGRGHITQSIGHAELAQRLDALATAHLDDLTAALGQILGRDRKSGCMTICTDTETGAHLILAICDNVRILALVDPYKVDALLPVLQDIFAK